MQDTPNARPLDAQTREWLANLEDLGEERGYFEPLGLAHFAVLTDASPTLLVTFETIDTIIDDTEGALPLGFDLVSENGWSHLGIIANGNTWFRDKSVYGYFDRLVDDGFFEDFDQVIFMGSGMCGYAAAAYSVVAPGCTVMVFNPLATLDPRVTEWDHRFGSMRRTSFTDRYGFAPDMIDAADQVFVFYDPEEEMDAMHAALFTRPHVTKLRCRHLGRHIMQDMIHMDILQPLLETAGDGGDIASHFHRLFRARHTYSPYLRRLLMRLDDDDRSMLSGLLCRNVVGRMKAPRFRRRLNAIESQLAESGRSLPRQRKTVSAT
ncbi:MAG: phosphoadenosine phosphosulfate reductase [Marinosulfonomonas sp.]|nr:phosphoadenosine phosphosulfate reductase [Marinosulfonomonas sp.]